jgi:molybdenum ABC transporter molybdate-binding protein
MKARSLALIAAAVFLLGSTAIAAPLNFTVPRVNDVMDLHGDPAGADLVLYVGGNQWMAMPDMIAAFQQAHPEVKHIFYETLPPGILAQQLTSDGLDVGELHISAKADVYMSGARRMDEERRAGLVGAPVTYASNELVIIVPASNPKHVSGLRDLARPDVRVAMPNPQFEGIALQILAAYRAAGGDQLVAQIMNAKVSNGTTRLTRIHHRESIAWIRDGSADAGVVWLTEGLYQERIKSGIGMVKIPASQNIHAKCQAALVTNTPHAAAAQAFVQFLASDAGQGIFRSYGFAPPAVKE